jgi:hypothetical protein
MKEIRLEDVLDEFFETHDTCTMQQLYHWVHDYREKHHCYVPYDRDELDYIFYTLKTYFFDDKNEVIRKQEVITCLCCGSEFKKYPDTEKFEKIKSYNNKVKFWSFKNKKKA